MSEFARANACIATLNVMFKYGRDDEVPSWVTDTLIELLEDSLSRLDPLHESIILEAVYQD